MASADRETLRDQAIRLGRIGSNVSTTILNGWIYEATKRLQYDTKWLAKTRNYYVREYFSVGTDEGIGVILDTATGTVNVIGSDTAYTNITGSSMAQLLSTQWENIVGDTGFYFSYSTADRTFTAAMSTATYTSTGFLIGNPDYDTTYIYGLSYKLLDLTDWSSYSETSNEFDPPSFATSEYPLPSDFLSAIESRYDDKSYPLRTGGFKMRDYGTGTPSFMYVRDNYFGLVPQPTSVGKVIEFNYNYIPADYSADSSTHPFPEEFDFAIVYYTVALYRHSLDDLTGALKWESKYEEEKIKAKQRKRARVGGGTSLINKGKSYDPRRYNL